MTAALLAVCCCTAGAVLFLSPMTVSRNRRAAVAACLSYPIAEPCRVGLTKSQAEDLLDWLEANGRKGRLTFVSGEGFSVC